MDCVVDELCEIRESHFDTDVCGWFVEYRESTLVDGDMV